MTRQGSVPDGVIEFPPEWKLGKDWIVGPDVLLESANPDERIIAAGGCLDDGTNLLGLCWPGGQRVLRVSPDTDWAIEERFTGDAPERIVKVWRTLIEVQVEATHAAERDNGGQ